MSLIEGIGYLASLLVAISLLMSDVYKLRVINLLGAIAFVIYGYTIKAHAVWLVNLFIVCVDIYYIICLKFKKGLFKFIKLNYNDMVKDFISFYYDDMIKFFPDLKNKKMEELNYYLIIRNFTVVGVFGYRMVDDNVIIDIDYVVKNWRDLKNGINLFNFLSRNLEFKGKKFIVKTDNSKHISYLEKVGFKKIDKDLFEYIVN